MRHWRRVFVACSRAERTHAGSAPQLEVAAQRPFLHPGQLFVRLGHRLLGGKPGDPAGVSSG